jgi:hypothetical protein
MQYKLLLRRTSAAAIAPSLPFSTPTPIQNQFGSDDLLMQACYPEKGGVLLYRMRVVL